jgi:hypothetical protein
VAFPCSRKPLGPSYLVSQHDLSLNALQSTRLLQDEQVIWLFCASRSFERRRLVRDVEIALPLYKIPETDAHITIELNTLTIPRLPRAIMASHDTFILVTLSI